MRISNDYKGTAFGDPAMRLTTQRNENSKLQIANGNQAQAATTQVKFTEKFKLQASTADRAKAATDVSKATEVQVKDTKTVDFKGTAFGDPAATGKLGGNLDIYM